MKKINKKQKLIIFIAIIMVLGVIIGANVIKTNITSERYNSANNNSSSGNLLPEYIKEGITLGGVTGTLVDLDTSDATATAMDIAYGETAYVNGEKITGIFVPRSSLKVGDYVNYVPDTASSYSLPNIVSGYTSNQSIEQENFKWRILSVNTDGTVELISDTSSKQIIYFEGALGYNNGVFILNKICQNQYSNSNLGAVGRSIKIEDIELKLNGNGINMKNNYNNGEKKYHESKTYTNEGYRYYPNLYAKENGSGINTTVIKHDGINQSDNYYTSTTTETFSQAGNVGLTATQTYYYLYISTLETCFDNQDFYKLVYEADSFWYASRFVGCHDYIATFGIWYYQVNDTDYRYLFDSYNNNNLSHGRYLRPVVTIPSNVTIYGGDGSQEHPYQLAK